jgi:hypothetical protein
VHANSANNLKERVPRRPNLALPMTYFPMEAEMQSFLILDLLAFTYDDENWGVPSHPRA